MAEGNGELVDDVSGMKSDERGDGERTEDYPKLLEYGLDKRVSFFFLQIKKIKKKKLMKFFTKFRLPEN